MAHPYPNFQVHPLSNLSFPWAEDYTQFDAKLGSDGVGLGMSMWVRWEDMQDVVTELLGYSYREPNNPNDPIAGGGTMRRKLPWQHPYFNQLWVKGITKVEGVVSQGNSESDPVDLGFIPAAGGVGAGQPLNYGPWSEFFLARVTIAFWRPPYYVRSDEDVLNDVGEPQEWQRYVDRTWSVSTQMLSREGSTFLFVAGQGAPSGRPFQGSVGQKITKIKVKLTWHEIPQQCLFSAANDSTPTGIPTNLLFTQTATTNPITAYVQPVGSPMCGCVNSGIGGVTTDFDADRFMGFPIGTLLLDNFELVPKPLQLPPYLMQIPVFDGNEAISQQQYDVVFHFEYFEPPQGFEVASNARGHNLMPFSGNGLWYAIRSQTTADGTHYTTPFQYANFPDLFVSL